MTSPTAARIAAAARRILVAEGSAAVSMRRVARVVGVTPMAIYRHYANREELLRTVADTTFAELDAAWHSPTAGGDPMARLAVAVDEHLDVALARPNLYHFLFTEQWPGQRRSPTRTSLAAALTGLVAADHVERIALMAAAELHGLIQLHHGGQTGMTEPDFRAFCHEAVGRVVAGPAV